MTTPLTTERLREIAEHLNHQIVGQSEASAMAAELLAKREECASLLASGKKLLDASQKLLAERDAARAEAEKLRAELDAIRGRDAEPFDWDGVPTVEEWIAENLRVREPRAGSAMVELHPDEVVADRGESRRVAGWLKDLLAELAAVKRQRDELLASSEPVADALRDIAGDGHRAYLDAYESAVDSILAASQPAQQPKPVAWPHLPEADRPDSEVQP